MNHWFDPVQACWRLACPYNPETRSRVQLIHFRRIAPLAGAGRPPVFRVAHRCDLCSETHWSLLTSTQLDWDTVSQPLPPFWDLASGQMDWDPEGLSGKWSHSIRQGKWPLMLWCGHQERWNPGWPSLLSALEPDRETNPREIMIHYLCPACQRNESAQLSANQLILSPLDR